MYYNKAKTESLASLPSSTFKYQSWLPTQHEPCCHGNLEFDKQLHHERLMLAYTFSFAKVLDTAFLIGRVN